MAKVLTQVVKNALFKIHEDKSICNPRAIAWVGGSGGEGRNDLLRRIPVLLNDCIHPERWIEAI